MAVSKLDQDILDKYFIQMQSTFEYVLNRNDYNEVTPALKVFLQKIHYAGGGKNDVRYHLRDLGARYQRDKMIPLCIEHLLTLKGVVKEETWPFKKEDKPSRSITVPEEKEVFWKVQDFTKFSDEWAIEIERYNFCYLPDDMEDKLIEFFQQGNTALVFNEAFMFGDEVEADAIQELVEDLYKMNTPKDQWIDIRV